MHVNIIQSSLMTHLLIYCFTRILTITDEIQKIHFKLTILFNHLIN